ncbi:carbohydrate ABC transporter permease [Subdoligranulum variabile]|jgi:putative aldouronate transport system permease protein|uniref:carbohydrate ABC transporter permease n=1 Tax=Subdoligranulum variabile TaxID=214851 RepID=UPI00280B7CA3|nr:carbohydrate ABC transporter permease [Subdoligranulum variabile]
MTLAEKRKARKEEKAIEREEARATAHMNQIKPLTNALFNVLFAILSFICLFPVFYVVMISVSSEESIRLNGYALWPESFSNSAYMFLWNERGTISHALLISVIVTVIGTVLGVLLTTSMGYVLSRPQYRLRNFFNWVVFIPMIFNGGMVASYVVIANMLHLNDTIWCLILPLAVSSFNVIISKTFFRTTIPDSIIESAKIDGASQLTIFSRIVVPISKPVFATIGLFLTFGYWNDWFQSSLYISKNNLISLQALLNNMMKNLDYIANNPSAGLSLQQYRNSMPSESVRMAIAVVIVIPIACAYPFFQKYFISGLTIGAVKG